MASVLSQVGVVLCQKPCLSERKNGITSTNFNTGSFGIGKKARSVVVKAETGGVSSINPDIRKNEEKVVDAVVLSEVSKAVTPYCRYGSVFYVFHLFMVKCIIVALNLCDFSMLLVQFTIFIIG